ncbi:hypothetical protein JQX13_44850 [Archangium violaceum]|uniref:hypothetical protein n=1 Tax=Archangium violaceum TaxID=83451 RepID=UPI00193BE224|nr:hypothetical protein [Archangium violaceum]QRK07110.1 hypothetical protein JQX13_44850 [Archangium violaceum]
MFHLSRAFLVVLALLLTGPARAVEPGRPLLIIQRPPAPRPVELARFLESPGREEASVRLWLRFNREAHGIAQGTRDFLDTLGRFTAQVPQEVLLAHEHVRLDAELIAANHELVTLEEARKQLLDELGRSDPDNAILEGERPPPWSPDGTLERDALVGLVFARTGRGEPLPPSVDRLLARLASVDRLLTSLEAQLLPAAEESLGSALIALSSGEAGLLEVLNGLRFLERQQRARLELRTQRELLLLELAHQLGCTMEQLPWSSAPPQG